MTKILSLLLIAMSALMLTSCDGSDDTQPQGVNLTVTAIHFSKAADQREVRVTAPGEWTATSDAAWVRVTPAQSKQTNAKIVVTAEANPYNSARTAHVTIASQGQQGIITVEQAANESAKLTDSLQCVLPDYDLVWHDEFDRGSVLSDDWVHEVWPAGRVNNELQAYVDGEHNGRRVTQIVDGKLLITAFKDGDGVYSGRVYAGYDMGWQYGYFEAKIKLPKGKGTWPAFWMMPANNDYNLNPWPNCGEIDIMEEVGVVPNEVSSTIHCHRYNNGGTRIEHAARNIGTAESDFHVYSMEWTADYMTFYVDHKELLTYRNDGGGVDTWPFDKPFYLILNLAWGGDWGGMRGVDEGALPVTMAVEYVRVYQK
ncbi:MAG: family 16 glycosylhydrolase [Muribaculaceae bacterium]|nr:family 16 glycosylhydrolase [Muribaculaceae bacterium]